MEKVMVILLRLRRLNWNFARLYSTLIFGSSLCESCIVSQIKVLVDIMSFSYWSFPSCLEIRSERYGFSNADHQTVTWVNTEIVRFGNIFRSFYIIVGIARKLQSVVSLTSLIMYRSLLGFENRVKWAWNEIWEVGIVMTQISVYRINWGYLSFLWTWQHPSWHWTFYYPFQRY